MTLEEFRGLYPQYNDIPDLELAESLYEKNYSDVDKNEYYQTLFPNVAKRKNTQLENSLIEETGGIISPDDSLLNQDRIQNTSFKPSIKDIAIENDIGVETGANSNARFAASLGYDDKNKALAIKNVLSNLYQQDITVRTGANTGQLEFYNPETKKFELVNKPGIELGDFAGQGGNAMVILPDIAATVLGTIYSGGNLPAGITAGAFTAGVAEYGKYVLGKKLYGINKDVSDEELLNRALVAAGVSAGSAILGVSAAHVIKATANLVKGRFVKGSDIAFDSAKNSVAKADAVAKSINNTLDAAKIDANLKFSLGQATKEADILAAQEQFENINKFGYMDEFRTFNQNQADALNKYFGFLKSGFGTNTKGASEFEAGTLIQEVIKKQNQPIIKELIKKQADSETVLEKALIRFSDGSAKETGVAIRSSIDEASKLYKANVAAASEKLAVAANLQNVETSIIKDTITNLSTKAKNNLLKSKDLSKLFNKKLLNSNSVSPETLRNTKSTIQALIRDKIEGKAAGESVEVGTLQTLVGSINKQIKNSAPIEYRNALEEFNTLVVNNKKLLNNELISKITKVDGNRLKIFGDEDVFSLSFKKGLKSDLVAKQVHEVIKDSPDAMSAYKSSIYDFYRNKVVKNGKINENAHKAFLKDYEAPLKLFFNEADFNKISKLGGFQKTINEATALRAKTIKEIEKSFAGKLERLTPGELVNKIYKANNIGEIRLLKKILQNDPEVYKAFQRSILSDLSESVMKANDNLGMKVIDPLSFNKYLFGQGERGYHVALREIFGNDYVKNLSLLNDALKITSRTAKGGGLGVFASAFTDVIRARLGQFTLMGRLFTAGRRIYAKAAERVMANAILNPASLSDLMKLRKYKPNTLIAIAVLSKLDGSIFIKDNFEDTQIIKKDNEDKN